MGDYYFWVYSTSPDKPWLNTSGEAHGITLIIIALEKWFQYIFWIWIL